MVGVPLDVSGAMARRVSASMMTLVAVALGLRAWAKCVYHLHQLGCGVSQPSSWPMQPGASSFRPHAFKDQRDQHLAPGIVVSASLCIIWAFAP
jgi:hypothetical protein